MDFASRTALVFALLLAALPAKGAATVERDDQERIVRVVVDFGLGNPGGRFTIEAVPGHDVRDGGAVLRWEYAVHPGLGGGVLRAEGVPIATAAPLARDPATGSALEPPPGAPGPSDAVFAFLAARPAQEARFLIVCATSVPFFASDLAAPCDAMWLYASDGGAVPVDANPAEPPYELVPDARSARDEALLGCGPAYGTSCDDDGLDLRLADASVLSQRVPGLGAELPTGGDSDVLQRVAWNWFAAELMRGGVVPGEGDAAGCAFDAPDGCAALAPSYARFAARRVLPDEPIAGPDVRWDWELGTTFELGPIEVEGDVDPVYVEFVRSSADKVHLVGPFAGAGGDPDAVVHWIPEPAVAVGHLAAFAALAALRRRTH